MKKKEERTKEGLKERMEQEKAKSKKKINKGGKWVW